MTDKAERLRRAREEAGFETAKEAAERFGWVIPTYFGHENGSRGFRAETAGAYARAFRVRPEWLLYGSDAGAAPIAIQSTSDLVPIYTVQASAGPGMLNTDETIVEKLAFPPDYLRHITKSHPRNLAIIGCKGDSMSPTLKDDDLVMIDTSKTDLSYEGIFVVKVDDGAALLVKRIGRASRRGFIMLISDNPSHPPVEVAADDVFPVGKVVWAGVKI